MSSQTFSTFSEVGMIDARSQNGIITLPLTTDIPYRILTLKDIYGAAALSSITLTTQGADLFEDGTTSRVLNGAFETTTLYAGQAGSWYVTGGSRLATAAIGSAAIGTLSTGLITNPLRLGTLSTQTAIQFPGLRSNYTGTVVAGQTTGVGTQELLLYQASSISDQIRLQTTGNIVFEAGASARSFPSTAALVTPTLYIAGSTSNVGIGTAAPAATLDVVGAGRFQTLSTLSLAASTINGIVPGAAFIGSTNYISATTVQAQTISTLAVNVSSINGIIPGAAFNGSTLALSTATVNTSNINMLGTLNMSNNAITNVGTASVVSKDVNLVLWFDAADLTTLFQNQAATTPVTATGQSILAWRDKSSYGVLASVASGSGATTSYASVNGNNSVAFSGSGSPLTFSSANIPSSSSATLTIFMACSGTDGGNRTLLNLPNTTQISLTNGSQLRFGIEGTNQLVAGGNAVGVISGTISAYNLAVYFQGALGASSTSFPVGAGTGTGTIGGGGYGNFSGGIYEILVFNQVLTTTNRQIVEGYLAWKWGTQTSLTTGHPYKPPTVTSGPVYTPSPTGTLTTYGTLSINTSNTKDFQIAATNTLRFISPTEWRYITSSVAGSTLDLTTASSYFATTYRLTGSATITITFPTLTTGAWWTFINAYTGTQVLTFAGTTTGLTSPYSLLQGASITIYSDGTSYYILTAGSPFTGSTNYISASVVQTQTLSTFNMTAAFASFNSVSTNSLQTPNVSAQTINTSTINSVYLSSVQGYISSLRTDSLTVGGPQGYVTIQDLTTGTVSTGQIVAGAGFISSLQINTLSFGPSGYVIVGDVIANSLSTKKLNTQALYTNNLYVGNTSTQSMILFPGIDGAYRGTAVGEQTTGVGTEELLLYKVSTTTDQIRLQTTGNIVFEAGASARSFPSTAALVTPTLYIAGSSSNVGIGTATPATTLDVVGTGRFQTLSSYALNVSSINGAAPGGTFNGSTLALSTALVTTSTLLTNAITTSSLTSLGTVDMQGNTLSNVATEYFIKPLYTTTFTPASISGLKVWLDASKTTSITSNGSAQVVVLSNLTGLGNATQSTPANAPLTGQYKINNLNVLSNSGNTQLVLPSLTYSSQYRTAFLVLQTPYYAAWVGANRSTDSIGMWSYGDLEIETAASWIALTSFPSSAQNIPLVIDIHSSSSSTGVYMNGSNLTTSLFRTFATGSFTDTIGLGGSGTPLGGYYGSSWYFGEFIYYDADLTVSQRQTVEGYLAWKWGFQNTLVVTHPYYSVPPPPLGTAFLAMGGITTDTGSNVSFSATNKIRLLAPVEIPTTLSTAALTVSSINGAPPWQQSITTSTAQGLGTLGYISTSQLTSTVQGVSNNLFSTSSTLAIYTSNTSNYFKNLLFLDVSTTVSTATLYTSNTSNYYQNLLLYNASTAISNVVTAATATSNYFQNVFALNVSSAISTATLYTSNTSNYIISTNQSSFSTAYVTANQGFISSLVVNSLAIGSNSGFINMGDLITTSLSSLQINTGLFTASGTVCTTQVIVSTINGQQPLTIDNLTSTVLGTNSNISSMIDPTELTSTVTGLGTANFISSVGLTSILASTVIGVNTTIAAMIDPLELASSITGLGTVGFISSIGLDAKFASTTQGLGSAGYVSSLSNVSNVSTLNINVSTINGQTFGGPIQSTVIGLGTAGYASTSYVLRQISSLSTAYGLITTGGATFVGSTIYLSAAIIQASNISTFQFTAQNVTAQAVSTNSLIFGSGTGTLLMPDIAPNTVYTSTVTTSNIQIGWTSNQSPIQFYGFGTYSNTVIVEQSTGTATQELFVFRGSNSADRIRFQTTGYMAIETGVASRLYTAALSNAIPAVMIDINSNVGIQLAAPSYPLDVGGTARAITLSSLTLQTSTIGGAIFTSNLYANANTYLQGTVSTSFLLGNYNSLSFVTAGSTRATFTQAGNLGIGLTNPQFPVDIAGITRVSTLYYSTSISYNNISTPLLVASTVNTVNAQITNISTNQINASLIYGRWNDAQYYVLQTL